MPRRRLAPIGRVLPDCKGGKERVFFNAAQIARSAVKAYTRGSKCMKAHKRNYKRYPQLRPAAVVVAAAPAAGPRRSQRLRRGG